MQRLKTLLCLILLLGISSFPGTSNPWGEEPASQRTVLSTRFAAHRVRAMRSGFEDVKQWARTYGDADTDETAKSIIQTTDGGYAFAGTKGGATWLVKTDALGKVQWTHTYNANSPFQVIQTTDGGFALTGILGGGLSPRAESNAFLVKTDTNGEFEWRRIYDWGEKDYANSVIQTTDGGFILVGSTISLVNRCGWESWLGKTDASGNLERMQTYGGFGDDHDHLNVIIPTVDGGFALAGSTWSYGARFDDFWLVKTDVHGEVEWNQTYGGASGDAAASVIQMLDGGYVLAGYTWSFGAGESDAWLVKTDACGKPQWNQTYGGSDLEYASGIPTADGGFALTGFTESYGAGRRDAWLVKTDAQGVGQWNRTYGGAQGDYAYSVIETVDGGFALAGRTASYGAGGYDAWVVKTDAWGIAPEPEIPLPRWVVLGVGGSLALLITVVIVLWRRNKRR
ncbi:MAG: hypothetical protein ACE5R6_08260 [Candidatus Heimdallarchaeota archaeon]